MIILLTSQNLKSECEDIEDFNKRFETELEEEDFADYFHVLIDAKGSFGEVAKINFENFNFVAKRIDLPQVDDENSMIYKEIKILKDLKEKNHLLQYYSCIIDNRENEYYAYILTETLSEDLDNYKNFAKLPQSKKISLYIQILEALKQLHSLGYIHNDIKPPNIMSTDESFDFVKLIDFGFTNKIGEISKGGSRFYLPFEKVLNSFNTSKPETDIVAVAVSIGVMEFGYDLLEDFIGSSLCETKTDTWKAFHSQIAKGVGKRYPKDRVQENVFLRFFKWIKSWFVKDIKYETRNMEELLLNMSDNNPKNIMSIDDILDIMQELLLVNSDEDEEMRKANEYVPIIDEKNIHKKEVFGFLFMPPNKEEENVIKGGIIII